MGGILILGLNAIFYCYEIMLIANILISWAPQKPAGRIWFWLDRITEPALGPCRDILNSLFRFIGVDTRSFPLDFSPMLALFLVDLLRRAAILAVLRLIG